MLYIKDKTKKVKRSYDYLHTHISSEELYRLSKKGKVTLSGKPKK